MEPQRRTLEGLRILVAEDELLVAIDIEEMLRDLRCEIVGPAPTVEAAVTAIQQNRLDGALLDMNLHGETALPAAEALLQRAVPFLLVPATPSATATRPR